MLKKILSSIGIGSAKIDLVLDGSTVTMGDTITGTLYVTGGQTEQSIGSISVDLRVKSVYAHDDTTRTLDQSVKTVHVTDAFLLQPNQRREFPFTCAVPAYLPASSVNTKFYFLTNLDIQAGVDSNDRDAVEVLPSGLVQNFLEGFRQLGCVPKLEGFTGEYQIFDFRTTSWLAGQLDELVFMYVPARTQYEISGYFEIDKKTSGIGGWLADEMDLDEKKGRFRFTQQELATPETARETIRAFVEKHFKGLIG